MHSVLTGIYMGVGIVIGVALVLGIARNLSAKTIVRIINQEDGPMEG